MVVIVFLPRAVTRFALIARGATEHARQLQENGARVRRMAAAIVVSALGLVLNILAIVEVVSDLWGSRGGRKKAKAESGGGGGATTKADAQRSRHALTHFLMRQRVEKEKGMNAGLWQRRRQHRADAAAAVDGEEAADDSSRI